MENDDRTIGRILSRREVLGLLGAAGATAMLGQLPPNGLAKAQGTPEVGLPSCIAVPEQAAGPFFVDGKLARADIRADTSSGLMKAGVPLLLALRVFRVGEACLPLPGATVDIWHCDALGVYSGVRDRNNDTVGQDFLRGFQVTDDAGEVRFTTIYPGWYPGRTVHIHVKVRLPSPTGGTFDFTSQLYFDDALSDVVFAREPYAAKGDGRTRNARDGIFRNGGERLMVAVEEAGEGYRGSFDLGLVLEG